MKFHEVMKKLSKIVTIFKQYNSKLLKFTSLLEKKNRNNFAQLFLKVDKLVKNK